MKCKNCEKLQAEIDRLNAKLQNMIDNPPRRKVHFDVDGVSTACGMDLFGESGIYADSSDDIREVTCLACRREWRKFSDWTKKNKKGSEDDNYKFFRRDREDAEQ